VILAVTPGGLNWKLRMPRLSLHRFGVRLLLPMLAAASMWLYFQRVLIPHQRTDSQVREVPRGSLSDLYPRWLGARELLLHGHDPYGDDVTREIQAGYYGRVLDATRPNDPKDQQAFAYPIYVVFFLAPTVGLPFPIVQRVFLILLVIATMASISMWLQALEWRISASATVMWIVLTLGSFPTIQGLKLQQLTLLVAALLAASLNAISHRRFVLAGILLSCATIKPQLLLLPVIWLCIWVTGDWHDRRRLFCSFGISMSVLVVGGELLLSGWIQEFRAACAAYYLYTGGGKSVLDIFLTPLWGRVVAAVLIGTSLIVVWRHRRAAEGSPSFQYSLALVMATTLMVIPMLAPYNQVLLVPVAMLIARKIRDLRKRNPPTRFLTATAALSVFWPWFGAAGLVAAMLFLPGPVVQRAWAVPVGTTLSTPVTLFALLFIGRSVFTNEDLKSACD